MPTILLVEDHKEVSDILSHRLQRRGFDVSVAADGNRAIASCAAECPDLVLLDMSLPGIDGWTVARRLKADQGSAAIPIIALTAYAAAEDRLEALQAGCDDYHPKPLDFSRLVLQIEAALAPLGGRAGE
jgi:CheY-like chemotaxis protein